MRGFLPGLIIIVPNLKTGILSLGIKAWAFFIDTTFINSYTQPILKTTGMGRHPMRKAFDFYFNRGKEQTKLSGFQKGVLVLQIAFVVLSSSWFIAHQIFPSLLLLTILLVTVFLWNTRGRHFLANFAPLCLLLVAYEDLRGLAYDTRWANLHVTDLIAWERALCGGIIPSSALQQMFSGKPYTPLLDVMANVFYMSHFIVPVLVAIILWQFHEKAYWPFILGLVILSYAGFLTYLLFPAAPPWWASYYGYLPDQPVTLAHSLISAEDILHSPNPVAAMPSLHAAYPMYISLYCLSVWGRKAGLILLLPMGVALSAIYLGHHYVIDILAGFAYAGICFAIVSRTKSDSPLLVVQAFQKMKQLLVRENSAA
jgi:membrane-associated phospholipid phosphatase